MTEPKRVYSFGQVFGNLSLLSNYTQEVCRQTSYTQAESTARFDVWHRMNSRMSLWGNGAILLYASGLIVHFMKGRRPLPKMFHGAFFLLINEHIFNLAKATGVLFNLQWAIDRLQIEEQGRLKANLDFFFQRLDQRIAHPEADFSEALVLSETSEHFMALEGKTVTPLRTHFTDETGRRADRPLGELMAGNEEKKRLRYCDNFYTRYIYYTSAAWFGRVRAMVGLD